MDENGCLKKDRGDEIFGFNFQKKNISPISVGRINLENDHFLVALKLSFIFVKSKIEKGETRVRGKARQRLFAAAESGILQRFLSSAFKPRANLSQTLPNTTNKLTILILKNLGFTKEIRISKLQ